MQQLAKVTIGFRKSKIIFLLIGLTLVLTAGFREVGLDRDSRSYAQSINSIESYRDADLLKTEPSFWVVSYVARYLFDDPVTGTFLIFALVGVGVKLYAIYRLSIMPYLSIFVYLCFYFILHEMTQIRVGAASAIFLLAIPDIYNKNLAKFLLKTLIAVMFHYLAIIMLPLYFLNGHKINKKLYLLLPLIGILCVFLPFLGSSILRGVIPFLPKFLSYKIDVYSGLMGLEGHNVFNTLYLSFIGLHFFCLLNIRAFKCNYDILLIKIFSIMLFLFYSCSFMSVLAFRISEFLGVVLIVLLPHFALCFKQRILSTCVVILYSSLAFINNVFIQKLLDFKGMFL